MHLPATTSRQEKSINIGLSSVTSEKASKEKVKTHVNVLKVCCGSLKGAKLRREAIKQRRVRKK
jgi:hypothetical protein